MELALISPPVGLNLFVLKGIDRTNTIDEIVKGVIPYAIIMVLLMVVLSIFPEIATFLIDDVE